MKTHEEIKRSLECSAAQTDGRCEEYAACVCCPLFVEGVGTEDIAAYIQQLEAQVPTWISVEERLPEIGVNVLTRSVGLLHPISTGWYSPARKNWCLDNGSTLKVTHWMPLPPAPKEG